MVSRFTENDVGELMRIWLEENLSAHAFIPAQYFYNHLDMVREAFGLGMQYRHMSKGFIRIHFPQIYICTM